MGTIRYVALLRGINVGGRNLVAMSDLRDAFGAAGFQAVRTYIQSGNVLFEAEALREHRQPLTTLHSEEPHNDSRGRGLETSAHPS